MTPTAQLELKAYYSLLMSAVLLVNPSYSSKRTLVNVFCRVLVADRLYIKTESYSAVASVMGMKHCSIMHYCEEIKDLRNYNEKFRRFEQMFNDAFTASCNFDQRLIGISTEDLIAEVLKRTNNKIKMYMNEYYFYVDGLTTYIEAKSQEEAATVLRTQYPDSKIEFIRQVERKKL